MELVTIMTVVFGMRSALTGAGDRLGAEGVLGFFAAMTLLVTFANSYLMAERMLFGFKARIDQLIIMQPQGIVLSTIIITYLANLRPALQIPNLIALVLAHAWFPQRQLVLLGLVFLSPLLGAALAVLAVLIIKRFANRISGLALIVFPALQITGLAGAVWFAVDLLRGREEVNEIWINLPVLQPMAWWIPAILAASGVILFTSVQLAHLWEEALLLQEEQVGRRIGQIQAQGILSLLSIFHLPAPIQAVILKEWLVLQRNPLTSFRILVWLMLSLVPLLQPGIRSFVSSLSSPVIAIFVIWYFCFGELIATTYQAEARRLGLLWLAAIPPRQLALGKFLAYLPSVFFAVGTAIPMIIIFGLKGGQALLTIISTVIGVAAGTALSLTLASLSMNIVNSQGNSITEMAFEQVPITFYSIGSMLLLGGFLAVFSAVGILANSNQVTLQGYYLWPSIVVTILVIGVLAVVTTSYLLKRRYLL
ncbi:MAG: hypothetical protein AB1743_05730 [Actinomycetota bacterium]